MLDSWTYVPPCHASPACWWGYEAVIAAGGLNSSVLSDVSVYVASMPTAPYSTEEIDALTSWFTSGNKSVWLASDSDFTTAASVDGPIHQNTLLEALNSKLRFEPSSVESPTLNIGGIAYRVLAPLVNRDAAATALTEDVRVGFFHWKQYRLRTLSGSARLHTTVCWLKPTQRILPMRTVRGNMDHLS